MNVAVTVAVPTPTAVPPPIAALNTEELFEVKLKVPETTVAPSFAIGSVKPLSP